MAYLCLLSSHALMYSNNQCTTCIWKEKSYTIMCRGQIIAFSYSFGNMRTESGFSLFWLTLCKMTKRLEVTTWVAAQGIIKLVEAIPVHAAHTDSPEPIYFQYMQHIQIPRELFEENWCCIVMHQQIGWIHLCRLHIKIDCANDRFYACLHNLLSW